MKKADIYKWALINAGAASLYITFLAWLMPRISEGMPKESFFGPAAFLTIFVVSAAVTGSLVLGRPTFWFTSGHKKEAVKLLAYTVMFLAVFALVAIIISAKS